jgi:DNA-binding NtrC family response regulator
MCFGRRALPSRVDSSDVGEMVMQVLRLSNQAYAPISSNASADFGSQLIGQSLIGVSRWTQTARMLVAVHAAHDNAVILEGERGTGKKLLARLIHRFSSRHEGPFVSLTLGSTSDEVARAVLFGPAPERSVCGASGDKGLAELAQGGTLYIDGLSEVSPSLTDDIVKLAERRSFNYEGERPVRILLGWGIQFGFCRSTAAVNAASTGLDYERIQIPPLRSRPDDIEALAVHFIRQLFEQAGKELRKISPEALKALRAYDWPRNVTELRALVNQLVKQLSPPSIDVSHLPAYLGGSSGANSILPASGLDLDNEVRRVEVDLICAALRRSRGLQNKAAQLLRIKPTTLFMKIRRHGIDVGAFR